MPIPRVPEGGWSNPEEITKAYSEHGWSKELEFDWITHDKRIGLIQTQFKVNCDNLECSCEGKSKYTFVEFRSTGIMQTCAFCRVTQGPLDQRLFKNIGQRRISLKEAHEILSRTNQRKPIGLPTIKEKRMRWMR